jgi:lipopolysaccharide export system permease protein
MLKHVDRLQVIGYFKSYFICLVSMLSLYVVVDLFTNIDDFTQHHKGLHSVFAHIGTYYGHKVTQIFDRLCEAIVLLAAMFTVALMQRNNELLPLLSAGMSTRRVVLPVLFSACVMLGLAILNQEFVIPEFAPDLMIQKDDPDGKKDIPIQAAFEPNGIHIEGMYGSRENQVVKSFCCTIPRGPNVASSLVHLNAQEARYIPPDDADPSNSGGWLLTGTTPAEVDQKDAPPTVSPSILQPMFHGKYFLHTKAVTFDSVTRDRNWFRLVSTGELFNEVRRPESMRLAPMAVLFHMRLTRPILGMILVLMGLSVILRDQNRNVFISAGFCLVLCAIFFAACFATKQLGENDILPPALAAWLPVLFFGPISFAMFDAVHT